MKKKSLSVVVMISVWLPAALLAAPGGAAAQDFDGLAPPEIPGEVVYIPFPVAIELDGELSDWEGVPVSEVVDNNPKDPGENGSFSFSVAADEKNFYITMQMPDKNIVAGQHGANFWNEDSFEFYINASGNLNARSYGEKIFQVNINGADIGNTDPEALTVTGVNSTTQKVRGFVFETETGWGFEAATPLDGLIAPAHGTEIGFQAQINGATVKDRDIKLIWSKADKLDQSWEKPYLFGRGIFFEAGQTEIPQPGDLGEMPTPAPTPTSVIAPEQISLNQTGYFVDGEKIAFLAVESRQPLTWRLKDSSGEVVLEGQAVFKGEDPVSRDTLHRIDFSTFNTPGSGYVIEAGGLSSAPFDVSNDIYSRLRYDALAYFYHNRSGIEIEADYVGETWARPAGYLSDHAVTCFQGEDAAGNEWPGCEYTLDVSHGWFDAGDYGKYVVNGGISAWTLMNLYERFPDAYPDGSLSIPENSNGVPDLLDEARWEMEFLLGMQVPQGWPMAGMAHHKLHDRTWAGIPSRPPTEINNDNEHKYEGAGRYVYAPSTAATLNLAATAAQCARLWQDSDADFSTRCLTAARNAWQAALEHPALYAGNTPGDGGGNYEDNNTADEFYWAAAELYITTGEEQYLDYLTESELFGTCEQFYWANTAPLGTISLAVTGAELPEERAAELHSSLVAFAEEMLAIQEADGYEVLLDGAYEWGSNGQILNNLVLLSVAYDQTSETRYLGAVRSGMDYILGRNAVNKSFVSGYGEYPLEHPHHRFWAFDPANGYPPPPPGAVSGGVNANPTDPDAFNSGMMSEGQSKRYIDVIGSYSTNEVAINWNAPLAWVATYLDEKSNWTPPLPAAEPAVEEPPAFNDWMRELAGTGLLVIAAVVVYLFMRKRK
ncbi:MAG: glycoside hydrolase family 9 protein [Anaerolineales bacterium]|nr:glycoside hydrolase family 9 protein [Anaerolineales bacterium]